MIFNLRLEYKKKITIGNKTGNEETINLNLYYLDQYYDNLIYMLLSY